MKSGLSSESFCDTVITVLEEEEVISLSSPAASAVDLFIFFHVQT